MMRSTVKASTMNGYFGRVIQESHRKIAANVNHSVYSSQSRTTNQAVAQSRVLTRESDSQLTDHSHLSVNNQDLTASHTQPTDLAASPEHYSLEDQTKHSEIASETNSGKNNGIDSGIDNQIAKSTYNKSSLTFRSKLTEVSPESLASQPDKSLTTHLPDSGNPKKSVKISKINSKQLTDKAVGTDSEKKRFAPNAAELSTKHRNVKKNKYTENTKSQKLKSDSQKVLPNQNPKLLRENNQLDSRPQTANNRLNNPSAKTIGDLVQSPGTAEEVQANTGYAEQTQQITSPPATEKYHNSIGQNSQADLRVNTGGVHIGEVEIQIVEPRVKQQPTKAQPTKPSNSDSRLLLRGL